MYIIHRPFNPCLYLFLWKRRDYLKGPLPFRSTERVSDTTLLYSRHYTYTFYTKSTRRPLSCKLTRTLPIALRALIGTSGLFLRETFPLESFLSSIRLKNRRKSRTERVYRRLLDDDELRRFVLIYVRIQQRTGSEYR